MDQRNIRTIPIHFTQDVTCAKTFSLCMHVCLEWDNTLMLTLTQILTLTLTQLMRTISLSTRVSRMGRHRGRRLGAGEAGGGPAGQLRFPMGALQPLPPPVRQLGAADRHVGNDHDTSPLLGSDFLPMLLARARFSQTGTRWPTVAWQMTPPFPPIPPPPGEVGGLWGVAWTPPTSPEKGGGSAIRCGVPNGGRGGGCIGPGLFVRPMGGLEGREGGGLSKWDFKKVDVNPALDSIDINVRLVEWMAGSG